MLTDPLYQKPMTMVSFLPSAILRTCALAVLLGLAACGDGDDRSVLERLTAGSSEGPDEFLVLPNKELEVPEDLAALPPPTPGAANRSDLTPQQDMLAALSGGSGPSGGIAADAALIAAASEKGRVSNIREILREEDLVYREDNRGFPLERLLGRDTDTIIYEDVTLNAAAEADRQRARGVRVPQNPPGN